MATFVLVPGMWLGAWVWRDVARALRAAGHDVHPLTLTGLADRAHLAGPQVDLDTHTEDIVRLITASDLNDVVLVGHSYGGLPVTAAAQRVPGRLTRVVYVDSGPLPDGSAQADLLTPQEQAAIAGDFVPPRSWEPTEDPMMLAGLDEDALTALRTRATPHPAGSVRQPLRRTGPLSVPTALVACLFPMDQVQQMMAAGHPFFAELGDAEIVGLPTGHWPMLSEPKALAAALDQLAH